MELDPDGYPQPTGRYETLTADTLILALGEDADTRFLRAVPGVEFKRDGTVLVGPDMMTGCPGVFAGGDMVPARGRSPSAPGHGKKAARHIDAYLRGGSTSRRQSTSRRASGAASVVLHRRARFRAARTRGGNARRRLR